MGLRKYHRYSEKVIRSKQWKSLRLEALRRDNFKCVKCGSKGRLEVDHIKPVRSNPELSFVLTNLQSLCRQCHSRKTRIEVGHAPLSEPRLMWRKLMRGNCPSPEITEKI